MQFHNFKFVYINLIEIIVVCLIFIPLNDAKTIESVPEYCPTYCYCDLYVGLNRADCSTQRLISPNVELPPAVEILDLSYNDITTLDNSCFKNFVFLQNLTISHNSLHTIYLDAFGPLHSVTHIDLSYNRLEYIDERIFESNNRLESLNLAANKFMSLQNKPLLRSNTLRSLNLRNSQINYIYMDIFLALPNLRHLDVSQNLMITLNMAAFSTLQRLQSLNLNANRWNCDRGLLKPVELLRKRGIKVELRECDAMLLHKDVTVTAETVKHKMFERLEMLDASVHEEAASIEAAGAAEATKKPHVGLMLRNNIANTWRRLTMDDNDVDDEDMDADDMHAFNEKRRKLQIHYAPEVEQCDVSWHRLCHKYRSCLSNMSILLLDKVNSEHTKRVSYTENDLNLVFFVGVSLGIAFVVCIICCVMCIKCCCAARKRKQYASAYYLPSSAEVTAPARILTAPPQLPQLPQRQRISRRRAPNPPATQATQALIRRDYATPEGRDNFLARLFGRPARHQYYRTINQNTATLIRRLSRSNLFANRLSQHFADESRQEGRACRNDSQTATAPSSPNGQDERCYEEILIGNQVVDSVAEIEQTSRPETPPPSYRDVVVNVTK